jgi:hypothetical protein
MIGRGKGRGLSAEERFNRSFIPEPNSGCWIWEGAPAGNNGYGRISVESKHMVAHRFSYELHKGAIPHGMLVLHTCDTPLCVNPDHLFLGDNQSNSDDKVAKQRHYRGTRHWQAKLTYVQVQAILFSNAKQKYLANKYGVTQSNISAIKRGKTWK